MIIIVVFLLVLGGCFADRGNLGPNRATLLLPCWQHRADRLYRSDVPYQTRLSIIVSRPVTVYLSEHRQWTHWVKTFEPTALQYVMRWDLNETYQHHHYNLTEIDGRDLCWVIYNPSNTTSLQYDLDQSYHVLGLVYINATITLTIVAALAILVAILTTFAAIVQYRRNKKNEYKSIQSAE